jgi:hypothetical protein
MRSSGRSWSKLHQLLTRLERDEQEILNSLQNVSSATELPEFRDLRQRLQGVLEAVRAARRAAEAHAIPRSDPGQYPPSNHIAAAILKLPKPAAGLPPQVVEIEARPTPVWPHHFRYRLIFAARCNQVAGHRAWFWGLDSGQRV